ncbi:MULTISPECIES: XRE family transcriptional regulator [unclassified Amycolatopsis]|uniref:helix-turn-helix domain-containing protein n=1 Tax=unclassified Amycolatopsis TaxID=2618356 RepID=UPI002876D4FD|nr:MULTISPECIES: XRE family transcriptional regulator [unclassified Amycolatopsis]MDS0139385.1 helix-turn-helix transcriptional regulator [Amycolatopsis sp. 505]MDS0149536.1 helix-turn-helix transcriptional regulator [Amycolatopsis sp. CM201R]
MTDPLTTRLAATVHAARTSHGLSAAALADRSGVSRAMIGKIERGDVQPTAALLAKLSAALGLTLSELIARAEGDERRLARAAEQPVWVDPDTGYRRRSVSPAAGRPLELVEVQLPAGAEVPLTSGTYAFLHQQIWVLDGRLRFHEGAQVHELDAGDCLQLGPAADCVFVNPGEVPCRYLVALVKRSA